MGILNMIYRYFRGMPAILFRVLQTVKEFHVGVLGENPMVTPIPCRGFGRKPFVVGIMAKVLVLGENPMVAGLVINGVVLGCYANATDSGVRPTPLLDGVFRIDGIFCPVCRIIHDVFSDVIIVFFISDHMLIVVSLPKISLIATFAYLHSHPSFESRYQRGQRSGSQSQSGGFGRKPQISRLIRWVFVYVLGVRSNLLVLGVRPRPLRKYTIA